MTYEQAKAAKEARTLVCGGEPGTDDYDDGYIVDLESESTAFIAWRSGVRTPYAISEMGIA